MSPVLAAVLAYTTRYFVNSDAIAYIEIGEAISAGRWRAVLNFTFSPAYAVLLRVGQILLHTTPADELLWLKFVNFFCFVLAMAALELFLVHLRHQWERWSAKGERVIPWPVVLALCYLMFLVAALVWIRVRLINPDMLTFAIVLVCMSCIMWITRNPDSWWRYLLLGVTAGLGYLAKSFFFLFSFVLFALSWFVSLSLVRALPRVVVGILAAAVVAFPLIWGLSTLKGSFSYGEGGRFVYTLFIAGQGTPTCPPRSLNEYPAAVKYDFSEPVTHPSGFDQCLWNLGVEPKFSHGKHIRYTLSNMWHILVQSPWLLVVLPCIVLLGAKGSFRIGPVRPLSVTLMLLITGACGTALFCMILMEPRYIAPFMFVGIVGMITAVRLPETEKAARTTPFWLGVLGITLAGVVVYSAVDESLRSLYSTPTKLSYREAYREQVSISDDLKKRGLERDDQVAIVFPLPVNWARMAGVKVVGEIPSAADFLAAAPGQRAAATDALFRSGIKAVVAKGAKFRELAREGWEPLGATRDYSCLMAPALKRMSSALEQSLTAH